MSITITHSAIATVGIVWQLYPIVLLRLCA
jgi:hypothetical protein